MAEERAIVPRGKYLLVRRIAPKEATDAGIIIPQQALDRMKGIVRGETPLARIEAVGPEANQELKDKLVIINGVDCTALPVILETFGFAPKVQDNGNKEAEWWLFHEDAVVAELEEVQ